MVRCKNDEDKIETLIAIEVASPSNSDKDYKRNVKLYRKLGVIEYIIVDSRINDIFVSTIFDNLKFNVRELYKVLNFYMKDKF